MVTTILSRGRRLLEVLILLLAGGLSVGLPAHAQRGRVRPVESSRVAASGPAIPSPAEAFGFHPGVDRQLAEWTQFLAYFHRLDRLSDRLVVHELGPTTLGRPLVLLAVTAPPRADKVGRQGDPGPAGPVILLSGGFDPPAVGGTLALTLLLHQLLTDNSLELARVLEQTTILLVPSLNPDGLDMVTAWYQKTRGTPAEGLAPPQAGPHYAGADLDGDGEALTQQETRLLVERVFKPWRPQVWLDLREGAADGAWYAVSTPAAGGNHLANLISGGLRKAVGSRRQMIQIRVGELPPGERWAPCQAGWCLRGVAAGAPRPGLASDREGKWTLADIIACHWQASLALLREVATNPARYRKIQPIAAAIPTRAYLLPEPALPITISDAYQRLTSGLRDVANNNEETAHEQSEKLFGEVSREPSTSREVNYFYRTEGLDHLVTTLKRAGVEVRRADQPFLAAGRSWPAGTRLVDLAQPAASLARAMLEPPSRTVPGSHGQLPLLLDVEVVPVTGDLQVTTRPEPSALVLQGRVRENGGIRVGLYRSHRPTSDEGWMRWVFDQYRFGYVSLADQDIRIGGLQDRFDAIIIPDQAPEEITTGLSQAAGYPAELAGGLGQDGIDALRRFVEAGGTLLTFNQASRWAIDHLALPVRNVLPAPRGSGSGTILRIRVAPDHPLGFGLARESAVWFQAGPAFEILDPARAKVVAAFPRQGALVLAGARPRPSAMRGHGALVEVAVGRGRVILFGFSPQYRGQSLVSYPFIFNSLMTSGH